MTEGREPRWPVGVPLAKAETEEESRPDAHEHGWRIIFKVGVAGAVPAAGSRVVPRPYLYPKFKTKRISTTSFRKCPTLTFYLILILIFLREVC